MLEPRPTRRDPRILALVPHATGWTYAVLDAWDARGVGCLVSRSLSGLALALERLRIQTAPTAVVLASSRRPGSLAVRLATSRVARRAGLPLVILGPSRAAVLGVDAPGPSELVSGYPELRGVLTDQLAPAVQLAAAALTSLTFPSRRYAPGLPARTAPRVVPPRPRRDRRPRGAHRCPARGAPRRAG